MKNTAYPLRPHTRAYEATSASPRVADWERRAYGPNAALDDADIARARSQDAIRNNPWLNNALDLIVSHIIGCGIQPRPKLQDPGRRAALLDLWNASVPELDADGTHDFYGWQTLLTRARHESGEVFIRRRPRLPSDGLTVPIQFQALEADLLPLRHNSGVGANSIRQGIERTPYGQRVAYWFYDSHPADRTLTRKAQQLTRIPAEAIRHHYTPLRPGQLRGEPTPMSALLRARNMDHFESAELARKKARAKFVGAIYKENPEDNPLTEKDPKEDDSRAYVDIEDAYMLQLKLHERVTLESGDSGGSGLIDFLRTQLRAIAAGMGVPFELMTGDYSGTNDRIMRVILNTFYRRLEIQQDALIAQVLQPVWNWWLDAVAFYDLLPLPGYQTSDTARRAWQRCEWRAHAWSYVNPLQEAQTTVLKIKNGLTSRSSAVAESGWDAEDIDRQQALDRQRERDLGLTYGATVEPAPESDPPEKPDAPEPRHDSPIPSPHRPDLQHPAADSPRQTRRHHRGPGPAPGTGY